MHIFNYRTDITTQKLADNVMLSLQRLIADFSIHTTQVQNDYILTLIGTREVSEIVAQCLVSQGVNGQLIEAPIPNHHPDIPSL